MPNISCANRDEHGSASAEYQHNRVTREPDRAVGDVVGGVECEEATLIAGVNDTAIAMPTGVVRCPVPNAMTMFAPG
jgi:hypothetical protein